MKLSIKSEGYTDASKKLKRLSSTDDAVISFIEKVSKFLSERSVLCAPVLSGKLRRKIKPSKVVKRKGIVEGGVEVNDVSYAMKMHEGVYELGPVSSQQPSTPEGGVGRKYIERPVRFHHANNMKKLRETIDKEMK